MLNTTKDSNHISCLVVKDQELYSYTSHTINISQKYWKQEK